MIIEETLKLNYDDVLIRPKRSTLTSRKEVDLYRDFNFRNYKPEFPNNINGTHYSGVPIMAANMDGVGTFEMAKVLANMGLFTCLKKSYSPNEIHNFFAESSGLINNVAIGAGIVEEDFIRVKKTMDLTPSIKYICVDVANGYTERFCESVSRYRDLYPNVVIIAGNVVTADQTGELILRGADIVKVGIGPGSVCTTRIKTGVGYPQLSAVIECADAAHGLGGQVIADGGCKNSGDVAKAFCAGADFVMRGGMLAGTTQGGGDIIDGMVHFYGMSSNAAQEKHGGTKDYRASEGRLVSIPHRGDVEPIVKDILGGIRSTCTYIGAEKIKNLSKCCTFVRTTSQYNVVYESNTVK